MQNDDEPHAADEVWRHDGWQNGHEFHDGYITESWRHGWKDEDDDPEHGTDDGQQRDDGWRKILGACQ